MRLQKLKMQPQEFRIQDSVVRAIKDLQYPNDVEKPPFGLFALASIVGNDLFAPLLLVTFLFQDQNRTIGPSQDSFRD